MQRFQLNYSTKELAILFITTRQQIRIWIHRKKFDLTKPISVFEFYRVEGPKLFKKYQEFEALFALYKNRRLVEKDKVQYVEKMLKEWGREKEINEPSKLQPVRGYVPTKRNS